MLCCSSEKSKATIGNLRDIEFHIRNTLSAYIQMIETFVAVPKSFSHFRDIFSTN